MSERSAEACGIESHGVHEREECDHSRVQLRQSGENFIGDVYWARRYFVSTVEIDEDMVRADIREQEREDERVAQMSSMFISSVPQGG